MKLYDKVLWTTAITVVGLMVYTVVKNNNEVKEVGKPAPMSAHQIKLNNCKYVYNSARSFETRAVNIMDEGKYIDLQTQLQVTYNQYTKAIRACEGTNSEYEKQADEGLKRIATGMKDDDIKVKANLQKHIKNAK